MIHEIYTIDIDTDMFKMGANGLGSAITNLTTTYL